MNQLPDVGRIQGVALSAAPTPQAAIVAVQYIDRTNALCEVRMSFLDALYLLNALEQISIDSGWDHLRRPRH